MYRDNNAKENNVTLVLPERLGDEDVEVIQYKILHHLENGIKLLVIDFSGVAYIASSGVSALLVCHKKADKLGAHILLKRMNNNLRSFFAITFLDRVFKVADEVEE